jgi:hypothetical protein
VTTEAQEPPEPHHGVDHALRRHDGSCIGANVAFMVSLAQSVSAVRCLFLPTATIPSSTSKGFAKNARCRFHQPHPDVDRTGSRGSRP